MNSKLFLPWNDELLKKLKEDEWSDLKLENNSEQLEFKDIQDLIVDKIVWVWNVENKISSISEISNWIWDLLNKNIDDSFPFLSDSFYFLSDWKFQIDFYDSISNNFNLIIKYFSNILESHQYDKIILSYELINKFFILNHWNTIEWTDIYWINRTLILMLFNFIKEKTEKKTEEKIGEDDLLMLNNIIDRFSINHTFLSPIDYTSDKSAINSFSSMLKEMNFWINGIMESNFWWKLEFIEPAKKVFLINYIYIYWLYLNFLNKKWLNDTIKESFFNFKDKISIIKKKEKLFENLLELYDSWIEESDIFNIDDILNNFLEKSSNVWYNDVMQLEIIHHIFSLYPEKISNNSNFKDFSSKMFLNNKAWKHTYNVMKLKVLKSILDIIDLNIDSKFDLNSDFVLDLLSNTEINIKKYGTDFLFIYSRISLILSGIYSKMYKSKIENWDIFLKTEKYKKKSIKNLSFYKALFESKTYSNDDLDKQNYKKIDNFNEYEQNILFNMYWNNLKTWLDEMKNLFTIDDLNFFNNIKNNSILETTLLLKWVIDGKFDLKKINNILKEIGFSFFINIVDIWLFEKNNFNESEKFYNEQIDLWFWYILNFNVNKKFYDLFLKIKKENKSLIEDLQWVLEDLIKSNNDINYNKITWLKNSKFLKKDLEEMEKNKEEWCLVVVEFDKMFYVNWKDDSENDLKTEYLTKFHWEIISNIKDEILAENI